MTKVEYPTLTALFAVTPTFVANICGQHPDSPTFRTQGNQSVRVSCKARSQACKVSSDMKAAVKLDMTFTVVAAVLA